MVFHACTRALRLLRTLTVLRAQQRVYRRLPPPLHTHTTLAVGVARRVSGVYPLKIEGEGQYDLVAGPHTGLPPPSASIATHHAGAAQIEGEAGA